MDSKTALEKMGHYLMMAAAEDDFRKANTFLRIAETYLGAASVVLEYEDDE